MHIKLLVSVHLQAYVCVSSYVPKARLHYISYNPVWQWLLAMQSTKEEIIVNHGHFISSYGVVQKGLVRMRSRVLCEQVSKCVFMYTCIVCEARSSKETFRKCLPAKNGFQSAKLPYLHRS